MDQMYEVEIVETYKCTASVCAASEEKAIELVKRLYEDGVIELDSEDITETEYLILKEG